MHDTPELQVNYVSMVNWSSIFFQSETVIIGKFFMWTGAAEMGLKWGFALVKSSKILCYCL